MLIDVSVVIAEGKRPVYIPNPEAKPSSADGTALGRVWESRTPPDNLSEKAHPIGVALFCVSAPGAGPTAGAAACLGLVDDVLILLAFACCVAAVLGALAWLGVRGRRRGVGGEVMGPFEEMWHPAAIRYRPEIRILPELTVPMPSADCPGPVRVTGGVERG